MQNNILSSEKSKGDEQLAFSVEAINPVCPMDELKAQYNVGGLSFTQMDQAVSQLSEDNDATNDDEESAATTIDEKDGNLITDNNNMTEVKTIETEEDPLDAAEHNLNTEAEADKVIETNKRRKEDADVESDESNEQFNSSFKQMD